jgi:hypothetical protein
MLDETGLVSCETGPMLHETGLISRETGLKLDETGLISCEKTLISCEKGLLLDLSIRRPFPFPLRCLAGVGHRIVFCNRG